MVCKDRFSKSGLTEDFFSNEWEHLDIKRPNHDNSASKIDKPVNLKKMLVLAEILSKEVPFLRIDFYEINNKLYFGEITFYPASGFEGFYPEKWDLELGNLIKIDGNVGD